MKLTEDQIKQIVDGLENRKTKLVATHLITLNITNVLSKQKDGSYKNRVSYSQRDNENRYMPKDKLIERLRVETIRHSFELITTNKDKSETRVKI